MDDISIILQEIAALKTDLRLLRDDVGELKERGIPSCAVHYLEVQQASKRLDVVEGKLATVQTVIGKKELIVACFGALGFGIAWAFKALIALAK